MNNKTSGNCKRCFYLHPTEQTEEECIEAVSRSGFALQYVLNQTYKICFTAVGRDSRALKFVNPSFLTYELCLEAVKCSGSALQYVPEEFQMVEIVTIALNQWSALEYVINKTEDNCLRAVRKFGSALEFVPENLQTDIVCREAVLNYPYAIKYVINQTDELCEIAIRKDRDCFTHIRKPSKKIKQLYKKDRIGCCCFKI